MPLTAKLPGTSGENYLRAKQLLPMSNCITMIIPARLCVLVASAHSVYGNAGVCATGDDNYYQNNITVSIPSPFQKGRVAP